MTANYWTCPDCAAQLARGNLSPGQVEAQMKRHARSRKHFNAVAVNDAWRRRKAAQTA